MRRTCPKRSEGQTHGQSGQGNGRRGKRSRVTTREGEGSQQGRIEPDDGHTPAPPVYTPNDFVNNTKALGINGEG